MPVPPPPTTIVPNDGFALLPPDIRGTPLVADGATLARALEDDPTTTSYSVTVVSVKVAVPSNTGIPADWIFNAFTCFAAISLF